MIIAIFLSLAHYFLQQNLHTKWKKTTKNTKRRKPKSQREKSSVDVRITDHSNLHILVHFFTTSKNVFT